MPTHPTQVLLWADDGAGQFSTLVTLSRALCDGQWHQLAGELGPLGHGQTHTPDTLRPPPRFCRADSLGGTWEGATWDSQAGEHVTNSPSPGGGMRPLPAQPEPVPYSDQRWQRPPARGGLAEQPDPGPRADGLSLHPGAFVPRGPAW